MIRLLGALCLCASLAAAQTRPTEEEMFGAPSPAPAADAGTPPVSQMASDAGMPPEQTPDRPSEDAMFGNTAPVNPDSADTARARAEQEREDARMQFSPIQDAFAADETLNDPLKIGGMFYTRAIASFKKDTPPSQAGINVPTIMDLYLDARPNERLRGMVVARMNYDPTLDPSEVASLGRAPGANPSILLDQLWTRFDIARTIFVTAGKQHFKWGASRFWTPTDYLHQTFRDPLAPFDVRTGTSMVKLHLPWEAKGWNFYALGLLDVPKVNNRLGEIGGALRSEIVLGQTEIAAGAVFSRGARPRYALDFSSGLGPIDIYGEVAFGDKTGLPLWRRLETPTGPGFSGMFQRYTLPQDEIGYQASGGFTWTLAYSDTDTITFGLEYFRNSIGYDDPTLYPWLIFQNEFQPFYIGKNYGAFYVLLNAPGNWERTNFTLSTLANLSDLSFVTRFDMFVRVLTHLSVEFFVAGHYGTPGGEFRFGLSLPASSINGIPTPPIYVPIPLIETGIGLRFSI
jgi:hypothetical protein